MTHFSISKLKELFKKDDWWWIIQKDTARAHKMQDGEHNSRRKTAESWRYSTENYLQRARVFRQDLPLSRALGGSGIRSGWWDWQGEPPDPGGSGHTSGSPAGSALPSLGQLQNRKGKLLKSLLKWFIMQAQGQALTSSCSSWKNSPLQTSSHGAGATWKLGKISPSTSVRFCKRDS